MPGTQRFLVAYSAVITLTFAGTVYFALGRNVRAASQTTDFDRIRVHRIDVVEPDGTERLTLSNRTSFPGAFFHGKEIARPDRSDSAGLLFLNDEGTEDGGLIFGGSSMQGKRTSFGHLSFDQYDQDETLSLGSSLSDDGKSSGFTVIDEPDYALSPEVTDAYLRIKAMPHGPERAAAWAAVQKKYPAGTTRAVLRRNRDASVGLTLSDQAGHERLTFAVAPDGTPSIRFLDAAGHVTRTIAAQ